MRFRHQNGMWIAGLLCCVLAKAQAQDAAPQSWDVTLEPTAKAIPCEAKVEGPATIVWEDVSGTGQPIGEARIGNVSLGNRILSGSRFTLTPDMLCTWDYDMGFRAQNSELRSLSDAQKAERSKQDYPWCKRLHDPCTPIEQIRMDGGQVRLFFHHRGVKEIAYPLDFGPDFEAVGLLFEPWAADGNDGTGDAGIGFWSTPEKTLSLEVAVSTDVEGKHIAARRSRTGGVNMPNLGDPLYMQIPNLSKFFVTFRQVEGELSIFAGTRMRVYLRYKGKQWPHLTAGANELAYAEQGAAPGRRRVHVGVHESGPALDLVKAEAAGNVRAEWVRPIHVQDAVDTQAGGYLRLSGLASGNWNVNLPVSPEMKDWRNVRCLRVHYRVPTWFGRCQSQAYAVWGDRTDARFLDFSWQPILGDVPTPQPQWSTMDKPLPTEVNQCADMRTLTILPWGPSWSPPTEKAETQPFCMEIGKIECIAFKPGEREARDAALAAAAAWEKSRKASPIRQRLSAKPLPTGPRIAPRDFLARGMWCIPLDAIPPTWDKDKIGCQDIWEYRVKLFEDMKARHLNACSIELTQIPEDEMDDLIKLADEYGIRIWGVYSLLSFMPPVKTTSPETIDEAWHKLLAGWERLAERYKDVPTLVAWEIGEEPLKEHLPFILEARKSLARLGAQPQLMLYNNVEVLKEDTGTPPLPAGACMDSYIFITLHTNKTTYLLYLNATWQGAKRCQGAAWFTPQMMADTGVYASLPRPAMRFQIWTALAHNVKGFFPWYYEPAKKPDFTDKDFVTFYTDEMGRLETMEKLLLTIERDDDLHLLQPLGDSASVGCFTDRNDASFRFAVIANLYLEKSLSLTPKPVNPMDRVVRVEVRDGKMVFQPMARGANLELEPGDGTILFVGHADKVDALTRQYGR
ncbi:MAG: hypothetical protein IT440_09570 [Phycisphaeraceae bacterium]|nr:hypothetical protein [Phycisphaeraceae bacterium]